MAYSVLERPCEKSFYKAETLSQVCYPPASLPWAAGPLVMAAIHSHRSEPSRAFSVNNLQNLEIALSHVAPGHFLPTITAVRTPRPSEFAS